MDSIVFYVTLTMCLESTKSGTWLIGQAGFLGFHVRPGLNLIKAYIHLLKIYTASSPAS